MFDMLNIRLSVLLNDPVTNPQNNGVTYTSALRVEYLNIASQKLWNILYNAFKGHYRRFNLKIDRFTDFVRETVLSSDGDSSVNVSNLRVIEIINLVFTQGVPSKINVLNAYEASLFDVNTEQSVFATEQSPKCYLSYPLKDRIYIKPNTNTYRNKTNAFRLTYLAYPMIHTVGSNAWEWNPTFNDAILRLAIAQALLDDGNFQGYEMYVQSVVNDFVQDITELKEQKKV